MLLGVPVKHFWETQEINGYLSPTTSHIRGILMWALEPLIGEALQEGTWWGNWTNPISVATLHSEIITEMIRDIFCNYNCKFSDIISDKVSVCNCCEVIIWSKFGVFSSY